MSIPSRFSKTLSMVVCSFATAHLFLLPDVFEPWNARLGDQLLRLRNRLPHFAPTIDDRVIHVDLNDSSLQKLDNLTLRRGHFATLARVLGEAGTAVQVYDLIFPYRTRAVDDSAFVEAVRRAGNVHLAVVFHLNEASVAKPSPVDPEVARYLEATTWPAGAPHRAGLPVADGVIASFPDLAVSPGGTGFINARPDRDGVFRRLPMLVRFGDGVYPSLTLRALSHYWDVGPGGLSLEAGGLRMRDAAIEVGRRRDVKIPLDKAGRLRINFVGPWERIPHIWFSSLIQAAGDRDMLEIWREKLSGKIVVVSDVTTGSGDVGPVPADLNASYPLCGLITNAIHTVLTRSFIVDVSLMWMLPVEALLAAFVVVLTTRAGSRGTTAGTFVAGLLFVAAWATLFLTTGILMHALRPLVGLGISLVAVVAWNYVREEREKAVLRHSFETYFPPAVVERIVADPGTVTAAAQRKEVTIMFTDIEGFSTYAADQDPESVLASLNAYFEEMIEIVFRHGGTIEKYTGDGLTVFFGDPDPQPDHALRCVRTAVEMQRRTRALRVEWESRGDMPIRTRIGIHTGEVVVGNMGSSQRLTYAVTGAAANLAKRIETAAPPDGVLITEQTRREVEGHFETRGARKIEVKGFNDLVEVYEVIV